MKSLPPAVRCTLAALFSVDTVVIGYDGQQPTKPDQLQTKPVTVDTVLQDCRQDTAAGMMRSSAMTSTSTNFGRTTPQATYLSSLTPELSKYMPDIPDHTISNHIVRSNGSATGATNYYNPARKAVYSRFSTADWMASNKSNFHLSERERSLAERLRTDAFQAVKSTTDMTRTRQASNTMKLGARVNDIAFWKEELVKEVNLMEHETTNLEDHRHVLEKALADTASPLAIAEDCLKQREKRTSIDLVHDDVERLLSKEVELIKRCQHKMQKTLEKASIQIKMNRAAQRVCEADVRDKHHSQGVDDRMYQLRNSSSRIGFYPGIENVDNTITVPVTWIKYTQENIVRSQRERENSERLRGEIDAVIRACANEMWNQFNAVNNAFNTRVQETTNAKNTLQAHLQRTTTEIRDMERTLDLLRQAIHDKEAPMKVAQTRLDERTRRLNVELCNDPVMNGLQKEVSEIRESVRVLKEKLRQGTQALNRMHKAHATLEHDIAVKENSLAIDLKGCMGIRKNMALDSKIAGPIFNMPLY